MLFPPLGQNPSKCCGGGWMGPRASLDGYRLEKISVPSPLGSNPPPTILPVVSPCADRSMVAPYELSED